MAVNIRPLHDRVIVQRSTEEEKTSSGLYIPDAAKEKPQQAKVIRVGNGKVLANGERVALDVKDGDTILFGKYSGAEVKIEGQEYLILKEDEILAIIG